MQNNDPNPIIDALMGFDHRELQRQMTDGLDAWCRRRQERGAEARLYLKALVVAALMALPAYSLGGTADYSLSGGMTHSEAITYTNTMLGR